MTSVGTDVLTDSSAVSTVAIIGNSPLSLFISRVFDQEFARQIGHQVFYFASDDSIVMSQRLRSLLGRRESFRRSALLENVKVIPELPKSINFNHQQLVTTKGNLPYRILILDQTPTFTAGQIRSIAKQAQELVLRLKAASNVGKKQLAAIHFRGTNHWSWQLALALRADLREMGGGLEQRLAVKVDCPPSEVKLADFFRSNGLMGRSAETILPGFSVSEPKKPVEVTKIKGANLDQRGQIVSGSNLSAEGNPNVFIIDRSIRQQQNTLQNDYDIAKQICRGVSSYLETGQSRANIEFDESMFLTGFRDSFASIRQSQTTGLKANVIGKLDDIFSRRLLRSSGF